MARIRWADPVNGDFNGPSNWRGHVVPGPNDAAILDAPGANFTVTLTSGVTVASIQTAANATLEIGGSVSSLIATAGTGPLTAGGANAGTIVITARFGSVEFGGAFNNTGSLEINAGKLDILSNATLYGGGVVSFAGGGLADLATDGLATLTNVDNTIVGFGVLDNNGVPNIPFLINGAKGVIDATGASAPLQVVFGATIVNAGLIEATGAAGLALVEATVDGSAGGVILAGAGSVVTLGAADIIGGILRTSGDGVISTTGVGLAQLDGTRFAVTNEGRIAVKKGQALGIEGSIVNAGHINVDGGGSPTLLRILPSGATLSGGGTIHLHAPASQIAGLSPSAALTNVDDHIVGAGQLGAGELLLINEAAGIIAGNKSTALVLDTGTNTIANAGHILSKGSGGVTIESAVDNEGVLAAKLGVLTVNGAVSGGGIGVVDGGTLDFASSFDQVVRFRSAVGTLELAQSQSYTAAIHGFSTSGGTALDLLDIGFVGASEATFSGTATSGVLTVTDGTHTARITLIGDYTASTFVASSDGRGGTIVVDPASGHAAPAHRFIAAAAAVGGSAGEAIHTGVAWAAHAPMLARPQFTVA